MTKKDTLLQGSSVPRKDIDAANKWHINDLFATEEAWADTCLDIKDVLPLITSFQGTLHEKDALLLCLHLRDEAEIALGKVYAYARLQKDADNGNGQTQFLTGTAELLLTDFEKAVAFIEPELLALPREQLQALSDDCDCLSRAQYFRNLLRQAEHVLSQREEELLAASKLATGAPEDIFHMLTGADMTFPAAKDSAGNEHPVSEGRYLLNMTDPDRELRRSTFSSIMGTYHQFRNTLATSLNAKCRSAYFYASEHKYQDTLNCSLDADAIPTQLYRSLVDTVNENLEPLHEYIAFKKQILNVDELHYYDMYRPLCSNAAASYKLSFEEACAAVKNALSPLGKEYGEELAKGLTNGWIDIYENEGKRSGAYSWGVYGVHPYVLLNYQPTYNSISTIAHEIGHALHSHFSSSNQPFCTSEYTIFCAEVASTTNEILLLEYMLGRADKNQKAFLINQYLEAVRTTVYRQTQFAEFEQLIHAKADKGESLTADYLEELWHNLNAKYYGESLELDKLLDSEWSRIPHFYTPFYVYKYATGYSAATTFAKNILQNGQSDVDSYLGFLKSGGSDYSLNLLKKAGVDLTTPTPVQITLQHFQEKLSEIKKLLA